MNDNNDHDAGPVKPRRTMHAVDSPRTVSPRPANRDPSVRGIDRDFISQFRKLRQVRHQWTAVLVFPGNHEEHHRFTDEEDLRRFLRWNPRYNVLRTFQTVIHPGQVLGSSPLDTDPVAA